MMNVVFLGSSMSANSSGLDTSDLVVTPMSFNSPLNADKSSQSSS